MQRAWLPIAWRVACHRGAARLLFQVRSTDGAGDGEGISITCSVDCYLLIRPSLLPASASRTPRSRVEYTQDVDPPRQDRPVQRKTAADNASSNVSHQIAKTIKTTSSQDRHNKERPTRVPDRSKELRRERLTGTPCRFQQPLFEDHRVIINIRQHIRHATHCFHGTRRLRPHCRVSRKHRQQRTYLVRQHQIRRPPGHCILLLP